LEPYFENLGKRLIKSPKLYLSDTGLLCFLLGLDERSLPQSPYLGAVWESAVYAQLRKQRGRLGERSTLWFYRDSQQREVDFVVAIGTERHLIEAKWTENPSTRDSQGLQSVAQILEARGKAPQVHRCLVCRTPHLGAVRRDACRRPGGHEPLMAAAARWRSFCRSGATAAETSCAERSHCCTQDTCSMRVRNR
jgi:hypothetical protein